MKTSKKKLRKKRTLIFLVSSISVLCIFFWAMSKLMYSTLKNIYLFNKTDNTFISEKEKEIINQFNSMINKNKDCSEIIIFIDKNIGDFSKHNAGKLLDSYEEYQKSKLNSINQYISSEDTLKILSAEVGNDLSLKTIKNINNPSLKDYIKNLYDSGYKLIYSNSKYICKINYDFYSSYVNNINLDSKEYFLLMNKEQNLNNDLEVTTKINWNDVRNILIDIEGFLQKNPKFIKEQQIKNIYSDYIRLYTLGNSTFSTFDKKNILLEDVKDSYNSVLQDKKGTDLYYIVKDLMDILSDNNYALSNKVEDYVLNTTRNILQQ